MGSRPVITVSPLSFEALLLSFDGLDLDLSEWGLFLSFEDLNLSKKCLTSETNQKSTKNYQVSSDQNECSQMMPDWHPNLPCVFHKAKAVFSTQKASESDETLF
jgi:hypothetical protein